MNRYSEFSTDFHNFAKIFTIAARFHIDFHFFPKHVSEHLEPKNTIKNVEYFFQIFKITFHRGGGEGGHPSVENSRYFIFFK